MAESSLVLVHSPFLGPNSWRPAAGALRDLGRRAVVPSLLAALDSSPPLYAALAEAVRAALRDLPQEPVTLVVHSGAGALVPSIIDDAPRPVAAVMLVDAALPHPGQTWLETVPPKLGDQLRELVEPDGHLRPWHQWFPPKLLCEMVPDATTRESLCADMPRVPVSYLEECAPTLDAWQDVHAGYLQLSPIYGDAATEARRRGWPVVRHDGHHLSIVTNPAAVIDATLATVDRLR